MNPQILTRKLVQFDTINPPGNEKDCCCYIGRILELGGFHVDYYEYAYGRRSLIARLTDKGGLPICFTGHLDTVPLGTKNWSKDPYQGELDGDRLYGRGSSDMKSGVAAMVLATLDYARQVGRENNVVLVLTAGEETGCEGAFYLSGLEGILGDATSIIVGEPTANRPFLAHKGVFWLKASVSGVTSHGSMPDLGVNAIYKAARIVADLESFQFSVDEHHQLGYPTLNLGTIRGGENINSVPDKVTLEIDIRSTPNISHKEILSKIQNLLGAEVEIGSIVDVEGFSTSSEDPFYHKVSSAIEKVSGSSPIPSAAPYFTDGPILQRAMGLPPMVILGPGEPSMAHQTDEYCSISKIAQSYEIYREILD